MLTASVIQSVKAQYKGAEAERILAQLGGIEPTEEEKARMVARLVDYSSLGEETLLRVLKECSWDADEAVLPLFNLLSLERKTQAQATLEGLYRNINRQTILEVLERHDGDVDTASNELLAIAETQQTRDERAERVHQDLVNTLTMRFSNFPREECEAVLKKVGWSVQDAVHLMLKKVVEKKVQGWKELYPDLSTSEIRANISVNDSNGSKTKESLDRLMLAKQSPNSVDVPLSEAQSEAEIADQAKQIADDITIYNDPNKLIVDALRTTMRFVVAPGGSDAPLLERSNQPGNGDGGVGVGVSLVVLALSKNMVDKGEQMQVGWINSSGATNTDWIGLYKKEAGEKEYLTYQWVQPDTPTMTFAAPSECGVYNYRYFGGRGYVTYGISEDIIVGPQFTIEPTSVTPEEIKLIVRQTRGVPCPNLWVGQYRNGEDPKQYLSYRYATVGEELTFAVPKAGLWNFRVFSEKTYDYSLSQSILVPGTDSIVLSLNKETNTARVEFNLTTVDPATERVWIGIYHVGESNNRQYRRYKNIFARTGFFEVKAMQTEGTYEPRLFANGTYDCLCIGEEKVVVSPCL